MLTVSRIFWPMGKSTVESIGLVHLRIIVCPGASITLCIRPANYRACKQHLLGRRDAPVADEQTLKSLGRSGKFLKKVVDAGQGICAKPAQPKTR
jgi:hypothetical protein